MPTLAAGGAAQHICPKKALKKPPEHKASKEDSQPTPGVLAWPLLLSGLGELKGRKALGGQRLNRQSVLGFEKSHSF